MWARWVAFCSRTEAGTSIAVFRIAMGLCVMLTVGWVIAADLVDVIWVDAAYGGMSVVHPSWWVAQLGGPTPAVMRGLAWAGVGAGALLALGLGGRLTALVTLVLVQCTVDINGEAGGSYDELLQNGLWLCVLGPTTTTLSLDCWLRTRRFTSDAPVGVWARYLIVIQLVVMYGSTGLQKLSSYWTPGGDFSALYYILQQPSWHRFDMRWLAYVFPLTQLATAVSWFWEVFAPVWLLAFHYSATADQPGRARAFFVRWHVREVYALIGLVFHGSLLVLMDVGPFSPISLAFYAALVHPWEWRTLARRP
ncbi:MAG: hypothetical protein R3F61_11260 [Myxococcota bacterium]